MKLPTVGALLAVAVIAAVGASGAPPSGTITTIAGTGLLGRSGDGVPAASARLWWPASLAVDGSRNVYFSEVGNSRVRKVDTRRTLQTVAGTGRAGFSGDGGPATSAQLSIGSGSNDPAGVAIDGQGNVYIADPGNSRVRRVNAAGTISTFAGTGQRGYSGDGGPATAARLDSPVGVAVDRHGNVYIGDSENDRVRRVSPSGTITTLAGTGKHGSSGDGGPATLADLATPTGVAVDGNGNVYIAEYPTDRVRRVSPGGTITTFAGRAHAANAPNGFSGDGGPAISAELDYPVAVAVDGKGNVFIADLFNSRVRKVDAAGTITTYAGNGGKGFSGDGGPATSAQVSWPVGVAVDGKDNVYIASGNRVRKVTLGTTAALRLVLRGNSPQRLLATQGITVRATCNRPCSLSATGTLRIVGTRTVLRLTRARGNLEPGRDKSPRAPPPGSGAAAVAPAAQARRACPRHDHGAGHRQDRSHGNVDACRVVVR